jgi:hypothetical protein
VILPLAANPSTGVYFTKIQKDSQRTTAELVDVRGSAALTHFLNELIQRTSVAGSRAFALTVVTDQTAA